MRLAVCLLALVLLAACVPTDPAGLEAQAAGMRQQTAEAVGMLSLAAQYTQAARDADATATLAVATMQVSQARATMEMAAAERAANAQAIDNARASATLAAERTEIAAAPIRAAATATQAAAEQFHRESMRTGVVLAGMLLLIFAAGAICVIIWTLTGVVVSRLRDWRDDRRAKTDEAIARAIWASYRETTKGMAHVDVTTGKMRLVLAELPPPSEPDAPGAPSDAESLDHVEVPPARTIGRLELFAHAAGAAAGWKATYIPGHREMDCGAEYWTQCTDQLVDIKAIPEKRAGAKTQLWNGWTLARLYREVQAWERTQGTPSPGDGSVENVD